MFSTLIIDLDGTVYLEKKLIPGADKAIAQLRKTGKMLFFLTNASMTSRSDIVKKLKKFGIPAKKDEIFSSSYAVAEYIAQHHKGKKVFVIGEGGIERELKEKGIKTVKEELADVVAVGLDRGFNYAKLRLAHSAIITHNAVFIAANKDRLYPTHIGFLPGAGSIVASIEWCTGKSALVLGKPSTYLIDLIIEKHRLKKEEMLLVGDNHQTDLVVARAAGIKCALVLSGVTKEDELKRLGKFRQPDFVLRSISDLPAILR